MNEVKQAWFDYCKYNYREPKYILMKKEFFYKFLDSINELTKDERDLFNCEWQVSSHTYYLGMRIILTNDIDTEFEIV